MDKDERFGDTHRHSKCMCDSLGSEGEKFTHNV